MKRTNRKKNPWADHYTHSQKDNFAARSVYKLQEIQRRFRIIARGTRVLDLGCSPGSWLLYAAQSAGPGRRLVGIDLTPVTVKLPDYVTVITGDADVFEGHLTELGQTRFDAVLSDMAPATTGNKHVDEARSMDLCEAALAMARKAWCPAAISCARFSREAISRLLRRP